MTDDNLPAIPDDGEIVEGEIVDEPQRPPVIVLRPVIQAARVVVVVVRHEHTQAVVRQGGYVRQGVIAALRHLRDSRTTAPHQRMFRTAESAGDHEMALKWMDLAEKRMEGRHKRRMERRQSMRDTARTLHWYAGGFFGVLIVLGILLAIARRKFSAIAVPVETVARIVEWGLFLLAASWLWLLVSLALAGLLLLHRTGRRQGGGGWDLARKGGDDGGLVVTADTIVLALQNLHKIPALKRAFSDGWRPVFTLLPVRDGRGYDSEFSVPLGVTAQMIADQRPVLARNMHRNEIETWPSAGEAGYVKMWVADRGAIGKAAPPYPLLHEGQADVFEGVPGGVVARGDEALIPVVGANGVAGGLMGQGKSNALRVVTLGCCTDPLCGIDVFVFANNGDFDAYEPRLAVYRKGLDDDVIEAAVERLHETYEDVGRREKLLADLGAKKLTRQLAQQYPELRPHVSLFSECHELFSHPEYGEMAGELAVKIVKRQRKTGRAAWFDTQSSRKAAIPPALVELVSVNCCFAVKAWRSNDGFLGDGSFAAGIRATELRPGRDRGTALVTGISDAQFELLKWYLIDIDDDTGWDAATDVIARCMQDVKPGTPVGGSAQLAITARDLLTDLAEVLRDDTAPARIADLPARLRKLAPSWTAYRVGVLSGMQLRELLVNEGVRTTNTGNVPRLDPEDLRRALAERGELDGRPISQARPGGGRSVPA